VAAHHHRHRRDRDELSRSDIEREPQTGDHGRRDSRTATGNFYIDEAVLREEGVTDFDRYPVTPGGGSIRTCSSTEREETCEW
jgi:hypothetical protein